MFAQPRFYQKQKNQSETAFFRTAIFFFRKVEFSQKVMSSASFILRGLQITDERRKNIYQCQLLCIA